MIAGESITPQTTGEQNNNLFTNTYSSTPTNNFNHVNNAYSSYYHTENNYYDANINPLFMLYTDFTQYQTIFNITNYFQHISTIKAKHEDNSTILEQLLDKNIINENGTIIVVQDDTFTGLSANDDVYIQLNKNIDGNWDDILNISSLIGTNLILELSTTSDVENGMIQLSITNDHQKMKNYMDIIMNSCAYYYFNNIQSIITQNINTIVTDSTNNNDVRDALRVFGSFLGSQSKIQFSTLVSDFQEFFNGFIKGLGTDIKESIMSELLQGLGNTPNFESAFYYALRKSIAAQLLNGNNSCQSFIKTLSQNSNSDVAGYFAKIITDVYIKCSYPLIQYQFIISLMNTYMKNGDFLNTRFGLLAKIYLVTYTVSVLSLSMQEYSNKGKYPEDQQNRLTAATDSLNDVLQKLNQYLININNIDISDSNTTSDQQFAIIVNDLKNLSNTVQSESSQINVIKNKIQSSSLEVRSLLENMKIIDKKLKAKKIEFWMVFSLLFIFIITCVVLIMIDQSLLVIYISAIAILLIILYKLCLLVISFV